jgi:uracil-DNA glycosylase family 4
MSRLLDSCTKCHRIHQHLSFLKDVYRNYHNGPVKGSGSKHSSICIVGLAPGLHGANRTGSVFNGDFSGNILNSSLIEAGFSKSCKRDYPFITNAVKCYPQNNKPKTSEIKNCSYFLSNEILEMKSLKTIISLGKVSHDAVLRIFKLPLSRYIFKHGVCHNVSKEITVIDSYHCSKININTKRVSREMLRDIFSLAKSYQLKL